MNKNPRTSKLKPFLTNTSIRLNASDREVFKDLAKIEFVPDDIANQTYYKSNKGDATRRLDRLVEAGLLARQITHDHGFGERKVYSFASNEIAKAWGGKITAVGANRTLQHELITTRLFYHLERPVDFRKENRFSKNDKSFLKTNVGEGRDYTPDALYTNDLGEVVVVEADSGQYNKTQIIKKQAAWRSLKQVWGQPKNAFAPIESFNNVSVIHFY